MCLAYCYWVSVDWIKNAIFCHVWELYYITLRLVNFLERYVDDLELLLSVSFCLHRKIGFNWWFWHRFHADYTAGYMWWVCSSLVVISASFIYNEHCELFFFSFLLMYEFWLELWISIYTLPCYFHPFMLIFCL